MMTVCCPHFNQAKIMLGKRVINYILILFTSVQYARIITPFALF